MKTKKRTKSSRRHGHQHAFRGAKERTRGHGNKGGRGMSGSGKRADQKKTLVIKKTKGNNYFGKDKTLRAPVRQKVKTTTLSRIQDNLQSLLNKGIAKQEKDIYKIDLDKYKILSSPFSIKAKIIAKSASKQAVEQVKKAGGELLVESK